MIAIASTYRLQVLQPTLNGPRQDCSVCQNMPNCWKPGISDRHIVTNLLVCRVKRGINRDKSTRLLLEMLKPKLVQLAQEIITATGASGLDRSNIMLDVQSQTIEQLIHHYVMGEIGYPLHFLFGFPKGSVRLWVRSQITAVKEQRSTEILGHEINAGNEEDWASSIEHVEMDEALTAVHMRELAASLDRIIDDGVTLKLAEYRVLRFCLDNATDAKRPLNGLHVYLGRVMGVVRSRVTKVAHDAMLKIREAAEFDAADGDFDWLEN